MLGLAIGSFVAAAILGTAYVVMGLRGGRPKVPTSDRIGWTVSLIVGAFGLVFVIAILTHL